MRTKLGLLLGLGTGYMFGTRTGREQYEEIHLAASKIRRFPVAARPLSSAGKKVSSMVHTQGKRVTDKVANAMKERLFDAPATPREVDLRFEDGGPNSR